jgi:hypothetical protein
MADPSPFLRALRGPAFLNDRPVVGASFTPGQALMISGDVPTDTYTVSSVAVLRDGTVVLQVARKDAQDG